MSTPHFAVVRRDYLMHTWSGAYTSSYNAKVERTTMTYAYARALCAKLSQDAGEPEEGVSWGVEPLTAEGRLVRQAWEEKHWALLNDEIPL